MFCKHMYAPSTFWLSHAYILHLISYFHETENKRQISHGRHHAIFFLEKIMLDNWMFLQDVIPQNIGCWMYTL